MTRMLSPQASPVTLRERTRDLLLALYRHPLTGEQLIRLNPTFSHPFPLHTVRREYSHRQKLYVEARTLTRLLRDLIQEGLVNQADYATHGPGRRPYYLLSEAGYAHLFPGQPIPKKTSIVRSSGERRTRMSSFFRPIPLGIQEHDFAVSEVVVHTVLQAKRDRIEIDACQTRHRVEHKIPCDHALTTALKSAVRIHPETGQPVRPHLSLYPDASWEFVNAQRRRFLRYDEVDGGSESVLSREDIDAIERKVRFYDHLQDISARRFRVRFITYRPRSFGRLLSIRDCVRSVLRNPTRPLFLFTSLERYLATNGALARRVFLDHDGAPVACVPTEPHHSRATRSLFSARELAPVTTPC